MNRGVFASGFVCLLGVLMTSGGGSAAGLQPGDAAPALGLEKLLQAPAGARADFDSLRGRVVVLEFWATWCAPCLAAQPHLNELVEKFKDREVQFISITDEDESVVAPFLARRTLKGWVGLDTDKSSHRAYDVVGVPKTVVIDKAGRVSSIARPNDVTEALLDEVIAGRDRPRADWSAGAAVPLDAAPAKATPPGGLGASPSEPATSQNPDPAQALLEFRIAPSAGGKAGGIGTPPGKYRADNVDLRSLLASLLGISFGRVSRIEVPADLADRRFDIVATLPNGRTGALKPLVLSAVETALDIRTKRVPREMDVYVLSAPNGAGAGLRPSKATSYHMSSQDNVIAVAAGDVDTVAVTVERLLRMPVVDETGLSGKFDWDLNYDGANPNSIIEAVRKDLGLVLTRAKRPVEFVVVERM